MPTQPAPDRTDDAAKPALQQIAQAVSRLRYGAINLTVHDGRVV